MYRGVLNMDNKNIIDNKDIKEVLETAKKLKQIRGVIDEFQSKEKKSEEELRQQEIDFVNNDKVALEIVTLYDNIKNINYSISKTALSESMNSVLKGWFGKALLVSDYKEGTYSEATYVSASGIGLKSSYRRVADYTVCNPKDILNFVNNSDVLIRFVKEKYKQNLIDFVNDLKEIGLVEAFTSLTGQSCNPSFKIELNTYNELYEESKIRRYTVSSDGIQRDSDYYSSHPNPNTLARFYDNLPILKDAYKKVYERMKLTGEVMIKFNGVIAKHTIVKDISNAL